MFETGITLLIQIFFLLLIVWAVFYGFGLIGWSVPEPLKTIVMIIVLLVLLLLVLRAFAPGVLRMGELSTFLLA